MIGGLPGNPFVFVQFEQSGGVFEFAALALDALSLHFAEFVQAFLELAGETLALNAEVGEEAMGVDDVKFDGGLLGGWIGSAGEQVGFEERDAIEAPGGVDELLDELGFGGSGGSVFVEEAAAMGVEGRLVFGRKDGGGGGQAWRSAFSAERCLPESVRGPVERRELARLMAVRDAIGVADMGFLATGIACARCAGWRGVREVLIGKRRVWREAGDCRWTGAKKYGSLHDPVGLRFAPT